MKPEIRAVQDTMEQLGYIAEANIATAVYLAQQMRKPLLIEGDAGVGKTEIAKVMARSLDTELIRLQCYEGLDVNTALYEWNYQRQLLQLKIAERNGKDRADGTPLQAARYRPGAGQRRLKPADRLNPYV